MMLHMLSGSSSRKICFASRRDKLEHLRRVGRFHFREDRRRDVGVDELLSESDEWDPCN